MNPESLKSLIASGEPHVLLHVLPEEVHAARRIPGSANACVYEMVFVDRVRELVASANSRIVVYGAGDGAHDAGVAVAKLRAAGFSHVTELNGGIAAWLAAGYPVEGHGWLPEAPLIDGVFAIDTAASAIRWTGRNLFNRHYGTVRFASGSIKVVRGVLESARFEVDMASIACEDLTDAGWNAMLIRHLQDADFFETTCFPTATFVADSAEPVAGAADGTPNHRVRGQFTLRGITRPLEFPAVIASADGKRVTGQAQVTIDRTDFGSIYGSGRFFRFLGKHVVNDHLNLDLMIHADRVNS